MELEWIQAEIKRLSNKHRLNVSERIKLRYLRKLLKEYDGQN